MITFLKQRRKAIWALLGFVVVQATVYNQLHPNAHVTLILTIMGLLGVGAVHQATNDPQA
jgi:hypothetical protein